MKKLTKANAKKLLTLADTISRRRRYDQTKLAHRCGSPSCAWGTYVLGLPTNRRNALRIEYPDFDEFPFTADYYDMCAEFGLDTASEAMELFSEKGCGQAGSDAKKAADYIRGFVARKGVE